MEIRQQVILSLDEINKVIADYLKKNGMRIKGGSVENKRDGGYFCLLMTEDEIYINDTTALLSQPLSAFEVVNKKLWQKIDKIYPTGTIANLLKFKSPTSHNQTLERFKKENFLDDRLYTEMFENEPEGARGINDNEEKILIKILGDLGIIVNKKPKQI